MAQRLPNPGRDDGVWGTVLNGFLEVSHNSDGTLQASAIQQAGGAVSVNGINPNGNGNVTLTAANVGAPTTLAGDSDVAITTPSNSQVLTYNSSTSKWTNQAAPSAPVASVFGRTGVITAQNGDYTAAQITNAADKSSASAQVFTGVVQGFLQDKGNAVYNVMAYGATGNGVSDDTAAINAALSAAAATGGVVFLPAGTYVTSATLSISGDSVTLRGTGWKTIIKPSSGANFDVISTPIPASAGLSGYVRNYIGIEKLMIDCGNMSGTTAGQGNGIHWYGVRYSFIRDVLVQSCPNWAILLDGDNTGPGNNFGYDNQILRCIFDLCNANLYMTNCEANDVVENRFKWAGGATVAAQPALGPQDTTAMHLRGGSGYLSVTGNIFGKGGTYSTEAIRLSNNGPCRIIGNRFDQVRNQAITLNGGNHIFVDNQLGSPSSNTVQFAIQIGSSNNTIMSNKFDNTAGAIHYSYAIGESGGPFTNNIIVGNNLLAGSSGFISLAAGSADFLGTNPGYTGEVTTTTNYTVLPQDTTVLCNQSAAVTITIPTPTNMASRVIIVKDISGTAATNNITITPASGTIDGAASRKLTSNYDVMQLVTDGTNWYSLNVTPPPTPLAIYDGEISQTSSSAGAINTAYLVAVTVPAPVVLTGVRVRFATGGTGHYDVGIYKSDGTNGGPKTLLAHAAATATSLVTSSATLTPAFTSGNLAIDKGVYWLALWVDNATDTFNKQSASGNMAVIMSGTTSGPLPSDATTLTGLANGTLKPILIGIRSGGWS